MNSPQRASLPAALLLALCTGGLPDAVLARSAAQTLVVQNCNDSGSGSLRALYAAATDGNIIDLSQLACSKITLTSGAIVSSPNAGRVVLNGPADRVLTLSGNDADRVIVHRGTEVAVNNLTVTQGAAHDAGGGGCIYSSGDIALVRSTVTGCSVDTTGSITARGGGVRALGGVIMHTSRVTDNTAHAAGAGADGGGVHAASLMTALYNTISGNRASGDLNHHARGGGVYSTYTRCDATTLSDNRADNGGAIYIAPSTQSSVSSMINATVSGNIADNAAGGVFSARGMMVYNSTIAGNSAYFDFGAGLYLGAGDAVLHSTIVANNLTGGGLNVRDIGGHAGATVGGAHNLVTSSTLALPLDTITSDPELGPLANNGGTVLTHALLPGSPAINKGENPRGLVTDERGFGCTQGAGCAQYERTVGPATDIGAFEFGAPDHLFGDGFESET